MTELHASNALQLQEIRTQSQEVCILGGSCALKHPIARLLLQHYVRLDRAPTLARSRKLRCMLHTGSETWL